jgi:hypothetical protein
MYGFKNKQRTKFHYSSGLCLGCVRKRIETLRHSNASASKITVCRGPFLFVMYGLSGPAVDIVYGIKRIVVWYVGITFIQNLITYLLNCTASHSRRL